MDQENLTTSEPVPEPTNSYEELSKGDAMGGVFTAPGETYETIANTPKKNYWIVPVLITVIVGLISTFLFMQDAELVSKTMDKQKQKMKEQFDKNVKEGKMTQEQSDKALDSINPKGTFFKIIGYGGSIAGPFLVLFILGLIYFVILKIMKAQFEFINILNVIGLAMLISAIGGILGIVLSILKGEMSTLGPGLFLSEAAVGTKIHTFLTKMDIFTIWFYIVVAIGLSKVSGIDMIKSSIIVFAIYIIYITGTSLIF